MYTEICMFPFKYSCAFPTCHNIITCFGLDAGREKVVSNQHQQQANQEKWQVQHSFLFCNQTGLQKGINSDCEVQEFSILCSILCPLDTGNYHLLVCFILQLLQRCQFPLKILVLTFEFQLKYNNVNFYAGKTPLIKQ